jgi:hypothetical protein
MPTIKKDPNKFKIKNSKDDNTLSDHPELDFVRKIANSAVEGSELIQKRLLNLHRNAISCLWFR